MQSETKILSPAIEYRRFTPCSPTPFPDQCALLPDCLNRPVQTLTTICGNADQRLNPNCVLLNRDGGDL
jgi:hypothetical protein